MEVETRYHNLTSVLRFKMQEMMERVLQLNDIRSLLLEVNHNQISVLKQ